MSAETTVMKRSKNKRKALSNIRQAIPTLHEGLRCPEGGCLNACIVCVLYCMDKSDNNDNGPIVMLLACLASTTQRRNVDVVFVEGIPSFQYV